jgi:hypothetical protein
VARLNHHADGSSYRSPSRLATARAGPHRRESRWRFVRDSCEHPSFARAEPERCDIRGLLGNHDLQPGEDIVTPASSAAAPEERCPNSCSFMAAARRSFATRSAPRRAGV